MLNKIKIGPKLIGGFLFVAAIALFIGIFGIQKMKTIDNADTLLYTNMTIPLGDLIYVAAPFHQVRVNIRDMIRANDQETINIKIERIDELSNIISEHIENYKKTILTDEGMKLFDNFTKSREAFRKNLEEMITLARANKDAEAWAIVDGEGAVTARAEQAAIDELVENKIALAKKSSENNTATYTQAKNLMYVIMSVGIFIAILLGIFLTISISRPLNSGVQMMQEMSKGHLNTRLHMNRDDEIGILAKSMDEFAEDLQNNVVKTLQKIADGDVSTTVKPKDNQDEISPALIKLTDNLRDLIAEMNNMSKQHDLGDIDIVIPANNFNGAYKEMANGVNAMVNGHLAVKKKAMACIAEFGRGNFDAPLEKFPGKKAFINETIEAVRTNLRNIATELTTLIEASKNGELSTRGNAAAYQGDWQKMIKGVNEILDAILEPINEASGVLEKVAARDMTARVLGNYKGDHAKIKNSLNSAVDNLDKALAQVSEATEQVTSASQQISSGSQSLAQGANEQASSLEEVSSSLEEMASMTKQNADNAAQAKNLSGEADHNAKTGADAMNRMSSAINKIKESSDQTAKIVKTIDEIAMQTNLLALNAAVEAARAGEAGRGFAVVAEEVRNLAQRSAQAAKNTADMISESVKNADDGVKIATEVSEAFGSIAVSSKKVNDLIAEIAAASQEQSQGIDQVNTAVAQMDKVTQQNAANSEESASAAEELSSQSEELKTMIDQFALTMAGTSHRSYTSVQNDLKRHDMSPVKQMNTPDSKGTSKKSIKKVQPKKNDFLPMDDDVLKEF
jgi:methyl-accepting chemotaxis protein